MTYISPEARARILAELLGDSTIARLNRLEEYGAFARCIAIAALSFLLGLLLGLVITAR